MKAHKDFSWLSFFVPIAVVLLLGIGSMKKTAEVRGYTQKVTHVRSHMPNIFVCIYIY